MKTKFLLFFILCSTISFAQNVMPPSELRDYLLLLTLNGDTPQNIIIAKDSNGNVINIDENNDGEIQQTEADRISTLTINGRFIRDSYKVSNVNGIEFLTNLKEIWLIGYTMESLIINNNEKLESIIITNRASVKNINLEDLPNLKKLVHYISRKTTETVNVKNCTQLEKLVVRESKLNQLNVEGCPNLKEIDVQGNELDDLNMSGLTNLEILRIGNAGPTHDSWAITGVYHFYNDQLYDYSSNSINYLDLTGMSKLKTLDCRKSSITSLDLTQTPNLKHLLCSFNQLTELNVNHLTQLTNLDCTNNQITTPLDLELRNMPYETEDYEAGIGTQGAIFDISGNPIPSLNLRGTTTDFYLFSVEGTLITTLDFSNKYAKIGNFKSDNLESINLSNSGFTDFYISSNVMEELDLSTTNIDISPLTKISLEWLPNLKRVDLRNLPHNYFHVPMGIPEEGYAPHPDAIFSNNQKLESICVNPEDRSLFMEDLVLSGSSNVSFCSLPGEDAIWENNQWVDNILPDEARDIFVLDELTIDNQVQNLTAQNIIVDKLGKLIIPSSSSLKIHNSIINNATASNFVVESGASLVQINDEAVNTGNITVKRNSAPMVRQDYTRWGAPVTGQNLKAFSPNTLNNRFYTLNGSAFTSIDPTTNSFTPGIGVAIRADNTYSSNEYTTFEGVFVGTPNNGEIITPTEGAYALLANPYPSAIDADLFFDTNTDYSTLYFWTHATPTQSGGGYGGANNYATYTMLGATTTADGNDEAPDGTIQVGQGFIVEGGAGTSATFNNAMRITDASGIFFKNGAEKSRIWLSIADENQKLSQTLIGYVNGATEGIDKQIDGKLFTESTATTLFTLLDDEKYAIEGRGGFSVEDVFTLGYKAVEAGTYTIALDKQDGLFADGQTVYLRDIATQNVHNLSESNYTFTTQSGEFTNAFEIVFQDKTLDVNDALAQNDVIIYQSNQTLNIQSKDNIKNVELFDMTGRKVLLKTNVNNSKVSLTTQSLAKQVLVVKVTTVNGKVVTKKIINK